MRWVVKKMLCGLSLEDNEDDATQTASRERMPARFQPGSPTARCAWCGGGDNTGRYTMTHRYHNTMTHRYHVPVDTHPARNHFNLPNHFGRFQPLANHADKPWPRKVQRELLFDQQPYSNP